MCTPLDIINPKRILKLHDWLKTFSYFVEYEDFCLAVEFHQGGSATNDTSQSSSLADCIYKGTVNLEMQKKHLSNSSLVKKKGVLPGGEEG